MNPDNNIQQPQEPIEMQGNPETSMSSQEVSPEPQKQGGKIGPIIGIIVIILIIIIGGLYIWGQQLVNNTNVEEVTDEDPFDEEEINFIEAGLETTDIDTLDSDFSDLEAELEAETQ